MFRGTCDAPGDDGAGGGYAHVTGAPPLQAIGTIERATGLVTVMGASGVVAQVKVGDPVYRHDTIETGVDGAVGITFTDGTAFNLSNNTRMALNEFVYDGTSNSALFSLSKGVFAFIAGKVAKAGGLRIDTPFARIRGAAQDGGIGILTLAALAFSTIREIQATSRSDAFLVDGTITYKDLPHGTFEITTRDGRVIVADDPGETIVVDPAGSVTRMPNSSSRMAELQQAQANALSTLSLGQGQQGAVPGGSSTSTFNIPLQPQPINFSQPQNNNNDPGPAHLTINNITPTAPFIDFLQPNPPPPPAPPPPLPPPTVAISTFAGRIAIDAGNIINANQANAGVGITGTTSGVEDGGVVTITIIDGSNQVVFITTTTVTNGTWLINLSSTDAKALADGSYTVTADVSNAAGNHALASQLITVDQDVNEHPSVLVNVGSTTPIGATGAGQVTFTISGLEPDDSGTLTFSDQAGHAVVVTIVNGQAVDSQGHPISTVNLSSLSDGTITSSLAVSDTAGNQFSASGNAVPLEQKLGEHPSVLVNGGSTTPIGAAGAGQVAFTIAGLDPEDTGTVTFTDANGKTVQVHVTGGQTSYTASLSSLADGSISSSLAVSTDTAGNTFQPVAGNAVTLDQDIGEQLTVNFSGLTGSHAVEDQTVTAIVTDTDNDVSAPGITYTWQISHDGGNTWSIVGGNAQTYTPSEADEGGLLKVLASFTDAAGNIESGSSTVGVLPLLTIANNSLSVSPNGSVSLGISLTQEPTPDDTISVAISFPSGAHDPTIAAGDHAPGNPHTSGGITTYTFSAADVNSGVTFTNHGDPVDTLTVEEILNGDIVATSQTITITDPPVSSGGTIVSDPPVSTPSENPSVQSTSAHDLIVSSLFTEALSGNGDRPAFLFKATLDHHITDPEINFAQSNAENLLHLPAQPEDNGVLTVTDGTHRSHPHFDVTQLASFKVVDDGSTHPIQQSTPADDDRHDPEVNSASNAKNHLLQLDDDGTMTGGAHPAHPHSDVTQLANFKFADNGSAHPGTVVPHDSPILTALLSDSSGTHGPAAPDLAKTFSVPGTVMSGGASDKFIFPENVDHDMVAGHKPVMTELDHTVPADIQHLLDAAHDTNAVSALDPNHTTAPQDMTKVQLPHHHGDFHFA